MSTLRIRTRQLLLSLAALLAAGAAHADIFGYIDAEGTAHFSTVKLDDRYQLFVRGDQEFNSAQFKATTPGAALVPRNRSPLFLYLVQHPNLKKYEGLLDQAARDYSLEPALLKAIMAAESGFNPTAVSPKGALGLMQLMPATAERYGVSGDTRKSIGQKLFDPKTNIRLGARYLRDLRAMFPGKQDLVIASYNAGEGAVQKYRNTIPPYPETRNYVQLVTQFYQFYQPIQAVSSGSSSATGASGAVRGRVQMTIPGRSNMPTALQAAPALPTE